MYAQQLTNHPLNGILRTSVHISNVAMPEKAPMAAFLISESSAISKDKIVIKGAREHNLKGVDLEIPRDKLVVLTGVSGSGKSSLAFDTLYAEGQRRYVESLSAYARQFLGQMEKPKVDYIGGLSPAIAIERLKEPTLDSRHGDRDL
jgi:ABC-type molybdenum transport system ATPase subunit/photorepair protein PhrA